MLGRFVLLYYISSGAFKVVVSITMRLVPKCNDLIHQILFTHVSSGGVLANSLRLRLIRPIRGLYTRLTQLHHKLLAVIASEPY